MRLLLVNPRGFCAGVRMAIDVVDRVLDLFPGETIYVYHEIVHNRHVVGRFRDRGVVFVESVETPPPGSLLIFSAHGIPPEVRRRAVERGLHAIDATCPLVTKVHSEAVRYARQGYQILLIGHRNHQEVIGTMGEAPHATQVVETPDDIPRLTIRDPDRLVYLTQTTLSTDDAGVIIDALKRAFPNIKAPPSEDICYATTNRQHAVRLLAPECNLVLVVGSRNSSNSVRLTEIAENAGTPARLIDDATGLKDEWFDRATTVGDPEPTVVPNAQGAPTSIQRDRVRGHDVFTVLVTAGASAPEDLVAGVCRTLVQRYGATIETRDVFDEDVEFALPGNLRRIMKDRGYPDADRRIRVQKPVVTPDLYGTVPLTINGR